MKKTLSLIIIFIALCSFVFISYAAGQNNDTLPRVVDKANLLTSLEEEKLSEMIKDINEKHSFDIVILTVNSIGNKTAEQFADDYYDYNNYGYGENFDGLLFMLNMEERDYYTSTTGRGIEVFTDYSIDFIHGEVINYLSSGEYFQAFEQYLSITGELLHQEQTNDIIYDYDKPFEYDFAETLPKIRTVKLFDIEVLFASLLFGFIIAFISVFSMKNKMKIAIAKHSAKDYVLPGTFVITKQADRFLFRTTTKVKVEKSSSNVSGKAGGSSVHTGSSGRSHGGGGGKF